LASFSPTSVFLSCFRFSYNGNTPDFRLRAVINRLVELWDFLTFSEAENAFALAAIEQSLETRGRKRKTS
jgi:hypothetical protein